MKLNLKLYFLLIVVFCCKIVTAQTLSLNDLINLQKSDYNKAKGFFQYKGFSSNGSKINDQDAVVKDNYQLTYNWYCWSYRPFNIWYIYKIGYENVLVYTVNETDYYALENSVKSQYKKQESTSFGRESGNCYRGYKIELVFIKSNTGGAVWIYDYNDIAKHISSLCFNCKGKGTIKDHEKCTHCDGDGKFNCGDCDGKGKIICKKCKDGVTECLTCNGKGKSECRECNTTGKAKCRECNGTIDYACPNCNGKGKHTCRNCKYGYVQQSGNPYGVKCTVCDGNYNEVNCEKCRGVGKITCNTCRGTGTTTCENCKGKGEFICWDCEGKGKYTCRTCNGTFSKECTKCNSTGKSTDDCPYCGGKGTTDIEIDVTCPACNGTKLRQ